MKASTLWARIAQSIREERKKAEFLIFRESAVAACNVIDSLIVKVAEEIKRYDKGFNESGFYSAANWRGQVPTVTVDEIMELLQPSWSVSPEAPQEVKDFLQNPTVATVKYDETTEEFFIYDYEDDLISVVATKEMAGKIVSSKALVYSLEELERKKET